MEKSGLIQQKSFFRLDTIKIMWGVTASAWRLHTPVKAIKARVPDTWIVEMVRSNEKVYMAESAKAIEISINKPIADSEFELDLSGGSFVFRPTSKTGESVLETRRNTSPA